MTKEQKKSGEIVDQSKAVRDKSRNEQQKSVLLQHLAITKHQKQCDELREKCEKTIETSKALRDEARRLVANNKDKRKKR